MMSEQRSFPKGKNGSLRRRWGRSLVMMSCFSTLSLEGLNGGMTHSHKECIITGIVETSPKPLQRRRGRNGPKDKNTKWERMMARNGSFSGANLFNPTGSVNKTSFKQGISGNVSASFGFSLKLWLGSWEKKLFPPFNVKKMGWNHLQY